MSGAFLLFAFIPISAALAALWFVRTVHAAADLIWLLILRPVLTIAALCVATPLASGAGALFMRAQNGVVLDRAAVFAGVVLLPPTALIATNLLSLVLRAWRERNLDPGSRTPVPVRSGWRKLSGWLWHAALDEAQAERRKGYAPPLYVRGTINEELSFAD